MKEYGNVQVVEKNPGTKIAWEQVGNKLIFGEDDLSIRCDTRQRDWPVLVDICADDDHNLVIGVGVVILWLTCWIWSLAEGSRSGRMSRRAMKPPARASPRAWAAESTRKPCPLIWARWF